MRSPAVRLAERYLENVKTAGDDNLRATCPFHNSPSARRSLYVFTGTGSWTCFGCGAGGTLPHLLYQLGMRRGQVEEALKRVNFSTWKPSSPAAQIRWGKPITWDVLPEWVLGTYDWMPNRMIWWGFDEEILQKYEIGYDRINSRITFPIRDHLGRLVGISGRAEPGGFPRYKVYDAVPGSDSKPPGELHGVLEKGYTPNNRLHLYGFDKFYAERHFRRDEDLKPLVVVEGYKGALHCVRSSFEHTSALQGSSLTKHQERVLTSVRGPYIVLLDHEPGKSFPDADGRCSAFRITERLSRYDRAFVCQYPKDTPVGTSPDDLSPDELQEVIGNAMTTAQAKLNRHKKKRWVRSSAPTRREK